MSRSQANLLVAIMLLVSSGVIGVVAYAFTHRQPVREPSGARQAPRQSETQRHTSNEEGPYPECPVVVAWLKENTADPKSLEIVRWIGRIVYNEQSMAMVQNGDILIDVKIRAKNQFGAMAVSCYRFAVRDGKYANSYSIHCAD